MIIAIVRFRLPANIDRAEATRLFEQSAPKYRGVAGLQRKHYLFGNGMGGGVYLWDSRAAAECVYTPAWRTMIAERYGAEPEILFFDTPVTVDNTAEMAM